MKKIIISLLFITCSLFASELKDAKFIDSVSLGFGQNKLDHSVFKLGVQKEFTSNIYETESGYLSGFYDLSLIQWNYDESKIYGLSISPVFEYYFKTKIQGIVPFINFGIGASFISKRSVDNKKFSTHFQFEDRIGMGVLTKKYKLSVNYFHYSNADIKKPNDGMDIILLNYVYKF